MDDEESYDDQQEYVDEDEAMDDEEDDEPNGLNGDAVENGSVLEPNLKPVKGFRRREQGLFIYDALPFGAIATAY